MDKTEVLLSLEGMGELSSLALTVTNAYEYVEKTKNKRKANVLKKYYSKRWLFICSEIKSVE